MTQSMWLLGSVARLPRRLVLLAALLLLAIPVTAQLSSWPPCGASGERICYDPNLINKLYNGDFPHISDNNFGRMDLEAVLMAFRTDAKAGKDKCPVLGDSDSGQTMDTFLKYIRYLNTDRQTGTFPSAQFMMLSVLSGPVDFPGVWALDPNMLALALEISEQGCKSARVQKIRENLIRLMDQRIAWHAIPDHSRETGLMKQSIVAVNRQALEAAVVKEMELQTQPQALRQIGDLEARGAQLSDCEYGPTNPDSTGSETVTFWYRDVPIPMADLLKLSHKHPLARFGDAAITTCPTTLADAHQKFGESRRLGQSHVDPSVLPAAHIPLTVMGKERYAVYQDVKKSWMSYQTTHDPRDQERAMNGKYQLLSGSEQACERMKTAGQPPNNVHCQIAQQLADEFHDIPDSPLAQRDKATPPCADDFSRLFKPECSGKGRR